MRKRVGWLPSSLAAAAGVMLVASAAHAIDIQSGDWKLAVTGYANGYEQLAFCNHGGVTVQGGFACQTPSTLSSRSGIQNGLGVGHFGVSASTVKDGWTLGGTGEIWSGILGGNGFSETTDFKPKANYAWKGVLPGNAWTSGFLQSSTTPDGRTSLVTSAIDAGARLEYGELSLVGYLFGGKGVGTAGFLVDGIYSRPTGDPLARTTYGYFGQLTSNIIKNPKPC